MGVGAGGRVTGWWVRAMDGGNERLVAAGTGAGYTMVRHSGACDTATAHRRRQQRRQPNHSRRTINPEVQPLQDLRGQDVSLDHPLVHRLTVPIKGYSGIRDVLQRLC